MPSSLAAALAATKKSPPTPTAANTPKKKEEPPRPSSLLQYQQHKKGGAKREAKEKEGAAKSPQRHHNTRNDHNKGRRNATPDQQKHTPEKSGDAVESKTLNKKGKKRGGKEKAPAKPNDENKATDEIVFVCDIPSDSDESDNTEECDGVGDDYYDGVDEDFEDDDFVDGDGADEVDHEEGECDDSDSDFDVVVVGLEQSNQQSCGNEDRRKKVGKGGRGRERDRGGRTGGVNRNNREEKSGGRGRGTPQRKTGRGRDRDDRGRGRDFRSDHTGRGDRNDGRAGKHATPTNPGAMPTPWSKKAQAMKNDHHGQSRNQHSRDNRPAPGRHTRDRLPAQERHHHAKPSSSKPMPGFAPASTMVDSNKDKGAKSAPLPIKLESAAIKGRWADEDSSDDE